MVSTLENLKYIQSIDLVLSISSPYILNVQCAAGLQQESQTEPAKTNFLHQHSASDQGHLQYLWFSKMAQKGLSWRRYINVFSVNATGKGGWLLKALDKISVEVWRVCS